MYVLLLLHFFWRGKGEECTVDKYGRLFLEENGCSRNLVKFKIIIMCSAGARKIYNNKISKTL